MKKSCENCGNQKCKNMMVAVLYDACLKSDYERFWQPQTNADRIRAMSDEELARFIARQAGRYCDYKDPEEEEYERILPWLKSPVEEVDNGT